MNLCGIIKYWCRIFMTRDVSLLLSSASDIMSNLYTRKPHLGNLLLKKTYSTGYTLKFHPNNLIPTSTWGNPHWIKIQRSASRRFVWPIEDYERTLWSDVLIYQNTCRNSESSNTRLTYRWALIRPNPRILFTDSKYETDPRTFWPNLRKFFYPKGKNWKIWDF